MRPYAIAWIVVLLVVGVVVVVAMMLSRQALPSTSPLFPESPSSSEEVPSGGAVLESPSDEPVVSEGDGDNEYWVTNPTSGSKLYVKVLYPSSGGRTNLPAMILVPGGIASSESFLGGSPRAKEGQETADQGFVMIVFDPEGRGMSEGIEDNNGFVGQDGLKAVIDFTANLAEVDEARIGIASFSFGIAMSSGVLARYPEVPIAYLLDWEGPTANEAKRVLDDVESRDAAEFISKIRVPYQRFQTVTDHVLKDYYDHTVTMVNGAVNGPAPYVRLNNDEPNKTYTTIPEDVLLPETFDKNIMVEIASYANALMAL